MATFTSLGIGSGLDLNSMVTQLVALERSPLTALKSSANKLQTQVSSFGQIQSLFGTLQDAANKLSGNSLWAATKATSGDESVVQAVGGDGAAAGNYAVTVQSLAGSQTLSSGATFGASTETVGAGTLRITLGSWNADQTGFDPKSGAAAVNVDIKAGDSLASVRDKINSAGAGVTATLVSDASGVRLAIRSNETGVENGFRIEATDSDGSHTDASGLSRLAFDPPSGATGMQIKQEAVNAKATVNGIQVESASNELKGVVDGLTLRLRKESATPVDVAVTNDDESVKSAVKSFAEAYNSLAKYISDQTKYDAGTKVAGTLQGDSAVSSLRSQLRAVLGTISGASAAFPRLSDIGLQVTRDGTLTVDDAKLSAALTNRPELKKAFTNSDTAHPENNGFGRRYAELASRALGVQGAISTRQEGLRKLISKNTDDQDKVNDRADRFQQRIVAQYTAMDANLSKLNALSSYVTQQLAALTASNN